MARAAVRQSELLESRDNLKMNNLTKPSLHTTRHNIDPSEEKKRREREKEGGRERERYIHIVYMYFLASPDAASVLDVHRFPSTSSCTSLTLIS